MTDDAFTAEPVSFAIRFWTRTIFVNFISNRTLNGFIFHICLTLQNLIHDLLYGVVTIEQRYVILVNKYIDAGTRLVNTILDIYIPSTDYVTS